MKKINLKTKNFKIKNDLRKEYSKSPYIYLNEETTEALEKARELLPENYDFLIMDGLRSLAEQIRIVKNAEKEFKESNPANWEELLDIYTGGYKDLKEKTFGFMNHRSGSAVDLTLMKDNKELDLGGVQLNNRDSLNYYERQKKLSKKEAQIKKHRKILKKVMTRVGFKPFLKEWWHWGFEI